MRCFKVQLVSFRLVIRLLLLHFKIPGGGSWGVIFLLDTHVRELRYQF